MDGILSNHIIGTDMTYTMTARTATTFTIDIQTQVFRDAFQNGSPNPTPPEDFLEVAIYSRNGNGWDLVEVFEVFPDANERALVLGDNICFDTELLDIFSAGTTSYTLTNVTLDVIMEDYLIAFQRCCRQELLTNIIAGDDTGSATIALISAETQQLQNDSPVFANDPEIVICNGFEQEIDISATDADGDEIRYSLFRPATAGGPRGGTAAGCQGQSMFCRQECDGILPDPDDCRPDLFGEVNYRTGFNEQNPFISTTGFTIDQTTGVLSGTATALGVYLIGVIAEEVRNGVVIGETRRDFNVTVTNCDARPIIGPPGGNITVLENECMTAPFMVTSAQTSCGETNVQVDNFTRQDSTTTPFIWRVFDSSGSEIQSNNVDWTPVFSLPLGTFELEFTIFPNEICAALCSYTLVVQEELIPDFDVTPAAPCSGDQVLFQNTSNVPLGTSFVWDFGNGSGSTDENPDPVQYTTDGDFDVVLEVIDGVCRETMIQTVNYVAPVGPIAINPSSIAECVGTPITFANTIPADFTVEWNFGDGTISTELEPEHTFTTEGQFQVTVDATAPNGCPADDNVNIQTTAVPDNMFTVSSSDICEGDPFIVVPAIQDPSLSYSWDFDDGTTSSDILPDPIQYTIEDSYDISLVVSNGTCVSEPAVETVQFILPPGGFTIQPSRFLACSPAEITFENSLNASSVFDIEWDFGDGEGSTEISPTHTYTQGGNFIASFELIAPTGEVCRDDQFNLTIVEGPDAAFSVNPNPVPNPTQVVNFTNETIPITADFEWEFGDGNESTDVNPNHIYNQPGAFTVELIARTLTGNADIETCIDTAFVEVFVESDGLPIFPNAFRPLGNQNIEFRGVSVFTSFSTFQLTIWDRWGQQVFLTNEFDEGWNGRKDNMGALLPQGVYAYRADYSILSATGTSMQQPTISGTVLLLN